MDFKLDFKRLYDLFALYFQLKEKSELNSEEEKLFQQMKTLLPPVIKGNNENATENLKWWITPQWSDFVREGVENMSDEEKKDIIKDFIKKDEEEYFKEKPLALEDKFLVDAYNVIRFQDKNLYREVLIENKSIPANANDTLLNTTATLIPEIERVVNKKAEHNLKGIDKGLGYCYSFWREKKRILKTEYGIDWLSPADRNPGVLYD